MATVYYVGTSGWNYAHWRGAFYPQGVAQRRWLEYYATRFNAVEVNATFYRTFPDATFQQWRERAPQGFRYVLKAPRLITHRRYLQDAADLIGAFWRQAQLLGDRLGLILLQLAPQTPYDPERLHRALQAFPDPTRVAVEFRRDDWLTDEVHALLKQLGACFVAVDSPKMRPLDWLTGQVGYLRLHGRKRWYAHNYAHAELEEFASLIKTWARRRAKEVYAFFNNDVEGHAVRNAEALARLLLSAAA